MLRSCVVLLLIACVTVSSAARARGMYNDPKNPGKCTIRENLVLSAGDIVKDPDIACGQIVCAELGLALFYSPEVVPGCQMGRFINKSLPYPACCKRNMICD